jgi:hypothetical protein
LSNLQLWETRFGCAGYLLGIGQRRSNTARADRRTSSIEIHEYDRVLAEGTAHAGHSALIDLIGVK